LGMQTGPPAGGPTTIINVLVFVFATPDFFLKSAFGQPSVIH